LDGILLALKRLCSKAATQRETHERREVLDLLEGDYSKAIPKMMTLGRELLTVCHLEMKIQRQDSWAAKSFCAVAAHSLAGWSASLAPSCLSCLWCSPGPGRTTGKRKATPHGPRSQAVSLQVCLISNRGEISRLPKFNIYK
jgi:hypothetical protein